MATVRSVIVGAVRTPFGRLGGGLASRPATELGAIAIRAALERAGIEPQEPEYVIMGQVLQAGAGQAPARQAAIGAGIPIETPADTVNKVCRLIGSRGRDRRLDDPRGRRGAGRHGRDGVDVERPVCAREGALRLPARRRDADRPDGPRRARVELRRPAHGRAGLVRRPRARHLAGRPGRLGVPLHQRAVAAADAGRFRDELVAVGELEADESPRRDTSLEKLASLKPVFDPDGTTTAGNAPGVNDGAGCVLVASGDWARRRGIEPLATIVSQGYVADEFAYLARTPARAAGVALARAGKAIGDVKRIEINEAFSSVAAHSTRLLGADEALVNVNGGAVALGHPIGASGARILSTLVHELRREGGGLGLAAICSGGGQGDALLIEV